jgi:hypothetical protein
MEPVPTLKYRNRDVLAHVKQIQHERKASAPSALDDGSPRQVKPNPANVAIAETALSGS